MSCKAFLFCLAIVVSFFVFFFSAIRFLLGRNMLFKKIPLNSNKAGLSKALSFSGWLLLSVFLLRMAVGLCTKTQMEADAGTLNFWEEVAENFFLSLRTFGIEEEYPIFIAQIKKLIANDLCRGLTVAYASVLEIIAPISGGAILLEILSSVFPKIQLMISFWYVGPRKYYYFNELNATSLALAKSIANEYNATYASGEKKRKKGIKPVLVFADTYVDREDEREYELLLEAKQYGAICVRDDLEHIPKPPKWRKNREYYLMDVNEFGNLQALASLTEERNLNYIKGAFIYLFVQSDAYLQVEKQVNDKIIKDERFSKEESRPRIVPVRGYRNLVQNLFMDVPLYEPLVADENSDLSITILGNGLIGTEAFLSAYWLGQMMVCSSDHEMKECSVTVNVVSKDDEETFWSKIDYVNREIQKTVEKLGVPKEEKKDDSLMTCDGDVEGNSPYCKVRYVKSDLKIEGFWDAETEEIREVLSSDYFIVALGSDADNISIASKIRSYIGKKHIELYAGSQNEAEGSDAKEKICHNKTVIAYAVFDTDLVEVLNREKCFSSIAKEVKEKKDKEDKSFDIYMHAFGSLEQVYSCENVYLSKKKIWEEISGKNESMEATREEHKRDNRARIEDYDNSNYDYWANLARALHVKYKVFSLGWIKGSIFESSDPNRQLKRKEEVKVACRQYLRLSALASAGIGKCLEESEEKAFYKDLEAKKDPLAWLEHRRWNAFTRVMGYRHMDIDVLSIGSGIQKDMRLKLHACLVEARLRLLKEGDKTLRKYMWMNFGRAEQEKPHYDRLDKVSAWKRSDYKKYDYYDRETDGYVSEKALREELKKAGFPDYEAYVCHELYGDAEEVVYKGEKLYAIPRRSVLKQLESSYTVSAEESEGAVAYDYKYYVSKKK